MQSVECVRKRLPDLKHAGLLWRVIQRNNLVWLQDAHPDDFYQEAAVFLLSWQDTSTENRRNFRAFCQAAGRHFYRFATQYGWRKNVSGAFRRRERSFSEYGEEWNATFLDKELTYALVPVARTPRRPRVVTRHAPRPYRRRRRFSDENLTNQLRTMREKLGRVPTFRDTLAANRLRATFASAATFVKRFGSYTKALEAAGLQGRSKFAYSDADLLTQLVRLRALLDHVPSMKDIDAATDCASYATFAERFGALRHALERAGLRKATSTKEEMLEQLRALATRIGRIPRSRDVNLAWRLGECPSQHLLTKAFGSYNDALVAAGLPVVRIMPRRSHNHTDKAGAR